MGGDWKGFDSWWTFSPTQAPHGIESRCSCPRLADEWLRGNLMHKQDSRKAARQSLSDAAASLISP